MTEQLPLAEGNINTLDELFARFDALDGAQTDEELELMVIDFRKQREKWNIQQNTPKERGRPKKENPLNALKL